MAERRTDGIIGMDGFKQKTEFENKKTFWIKIDKKKFNALEIKQQSWNGRDGQTEEKEQMNQLGKREVETEEIQKNRGNTHRTTSEVELKSS